MLGVKKDLTWYKGKSVNQAFRMKNKKTGEIISLDGYTARCHVRETVESEAPTLELTTENGGIVIDGDLGKFSLVVSADDTSALTALSYTYDIELIDADGNVYGPVIPSKIKVKPEVTR